MQLQSYVQGRWHAGEREAQLLRDATTGQVDCRGIVERHRFRARAASTRGARAARRCVRAHVPRARGAAQAAGEAARRSTRRSSTRCLMRPARPRRIPGSTSTAASARCSRMRAAARASCRTAACTSTATSKALSKTGTFVGQHICVPLEGAAVHINAFNFPGVGHAGEAGADAARRHACDREARDDDCLSHRAGRPTHHRVRHPAGRRAAAGLRQSRRLLRSSHVPGRRFVHRLGEHGAEAAHASGDRRELGALHQRDGFDQLLRARAAMPRPASRSSTRSCAKSCAR